MTVYRILLKVSRKDLAEKIMFEQRSECNKEASWMKTRGTAIQTEGTVNPKSLGQEQAWHVQGIARRQA